MCILMAKCMNAKLTRCLAICCLLLSQQAFAAVHLLSDGKVSDGHGKQVSTRLNVSDSLKEYPEGIFVAGYEIDASGKKVPTVTVLNERLEIVGYWTFKTPIMNFFRLLDKVYLFDVDGTVYRFENEQWPVEERWHFDSWARTYPMQDDVIVCHPAPFTKEVSGTRMGGCRSLARGWNIPLYWWALPEPKICGQQLRVLIRPSRHRHALQTINLADGSVVRTTELPKKMVPAHNLDLCKLAVEHTNKLRIPK